MNSSHVNIRFKFFKIKTSNFRLINNSASVARKSNQSRSQKLISIAKGILSRLDLIMASSSKTYNSSMLKTSLSNCFALLLLYPTFTNERYSLTRLVSSIGQMRYHLVCDFKSKTCFSIECPSKLSFIQGLMLASMLSEVQELQFDHYYRCR